VRDPCGKAWPTVLISDDRYGADANESHAIAQRRYTLSVHASPLESARAECRNAIGLSLSLSLLRARAIIRFPAVAGSPK